MDLQAQKCLRERNWVQAIDLYNILLDNQKNTSDHIISYLTDRAECFMELKDYDRAIGDSRSVILSSHDQNSYYACIARKRLIYLFYSLERYADADSVARDWLIYLEESNINEDIKTVLHSLLGNFLNAMNCTEQKTFNLHKLLTISFSIKMKEQPSCIYCNLLFLDKSELREHCQTEAHEMMVMSDDGRNWYWRPPPRGFKVNDYLLCENWRDIASCRYGTQCVQAHGEEELAEWKERFRYREMRIQKAREKGLFGKSYTEELLEKWSESSNPSSLMQAKLDYVECKYTSPLTVTVSKTSLHGWKFFLKTHKHLKAVALLQDTQRSDFYIWQISVNDRDLEVKNGQEWLSPLTYQESMQPIQYKVVVLFIAGIYGTFRQSIAFDFCTEPVMVKHLRVDVVARSDLDKINEIKKEITVSISERWTAHNSDVVVFHSTLVGSSSNEEWEKRLRSLYPCPQAETFQLSHSTVAERRFTKANYRERMHELLFIEEMARYDLIAQYNLTTRLQIAHSYILSPNSMASSTAKYSSNGELFASVSLGRELSEDTSEGKLILMHCNSVYLSPSSHVTERRKVYEALIEDKGKNMIYLRLSSQAVLDLGLTPDSDIQVDVQFQLNRLPYCEWHYTLDKLTNFNMIFPEVNLEPNIPWSPARQWSKSLDGRLNSRQKEAVVAITTPLCISLPPILVIGPFGTGKTFTLAQAIRELVKDPSNRILLCTHSNSAADLYIKDYLDQWVQSGEENATPLRIYYTKRWVTTVHTVVQKYCLIKNTGSQRSFELPTLEQLIKHRVIVVTLSTSVYLSAMDLPEGFFTHILLDEAAQALECETVTPLAVAHPNTRIVLAGDHMQLGPDIFSEFAKERNLHISLLERLYDHYPATFPCKILLCENYRAHETIVQFTSELFYDQKLVSSSKQPMHPKYYPLTFFTALGEDVQDKNSTAFYNNSEVYEVVEKVEKLKKTWPNEWGPYNEQSIGVVTPYSDQMFRIRSELRKRRIDNVCVERVMNVQGKQFRAIILSTVRTRKTCSNESKGGNNGNAADYGFLSNSKLLNTAITRAQSLVAVVGDPVALCSVGRCSKVWERFVRICEDNDCLFGLKWTQIKMELDGIELKKIYTLNPLAPEFYPRKYKELNVNSINVNGISVTKESNTLIFPSKEIPVTIPVTTAQILPPMMSSFPLQDFRYFPPLLYPPPLPPAALQRQQQPPQQPSSAPPPAPFLFNMMPPAPPLTNGYGPPIMNAAPLVLPNGRPVTPITEAVHAAAIAAATAMLMAPLNDVQPTTVAQSMKPQHPAALGTCYNSHPASNKLIQFMNNVHFPEAQVLNDCVNLLPQNMSLADMLLQPAELQEKWYNYLRDATGLEAAEKFKYLLHTTNRKGMKVSDTNIFERLTPQSCDSPTFNWYDSPNNQINFNKPVYMTENESLHQVPGKQNVQFQTTSNSVSNGMTDAELQRHINEEFANLNIHNTDVNEVFQAFTVKTEPACGSLLNNSKTGPKFDKYFH